MVLRWYDTTFFYWTTKKEMRFTTHTPPNLDLKNINIYNVNQLIQLRQVFKVIVNVIIFIIIYDDFQMCAKH